LQPTGLASFLMQFLPIILKSSAHSVQRMGEDEVGVLKQVLCSLLLQLGM